VLLLAFGSDQASKTLTASLECGLVYSFIWILDEFNHVFCEGNPPSIVDCVLSLVNHTNLTAWLICYMTDNGRATLLPDFCSAAKHVED